LEETNKHPIALGPESLTDDKAPVDSVEKRAERESNARLEGATLGDIDMNDTEALSNEFVNAASLPPPPTMIPLTPMVPPPSMLLPLPPGDNPDFVDIDSLTAALAKLNANIPIEDLIKVIRDEDKARRARLTAAATRRRVADAALCCLNSLSNRPGHLVARTHHCLHVRPCAYQARQSRPAGEGSLSLSSSH